MSGVSWSSFVRSYYLGYLFDALFLAFYFFHLYWHLSSTPHFPFSTQEKNLDWFPRMRAMSLVSSEGDGEQNEMRSLQEKLDNTVTLVAQLSSQLAELKEQVEYHFSFFKLWW